eukprot:GHVL01010462.1.p1 GENE.GHVL01010462.1~~GHVL01010462.1.p1  ORF type:complete len:168 (+),score=25.97 GHVL01010462.1:67-504(+)
MSEISTRVIGNEGTKDKNHISITIDEYKKVGYENQISEIGVSTPISVSVESKNLTGTTSTLVNSFIAFIGAGMLDLPYAFKQSGIILGCIILISIAIVSLHCMLILIDCKYFLRKKGKNIRSYGDIGYYSFGKFGAIFYEQFSLY